MQPGDDFGKAQRLLKQAGLAADAKVVTALSGEWSFDQPYMVVGVDPAAGSKVASNQKISLRLVGVTDLQHLGFRPRSSHD